MSSALGQCLFSDGLILFFEYCGTTDICDRSLRNSVGDVWHNWRANKDSHRCNCGREEDVVLADDYGGGKHWAGKACRHCKAITDGAWPFGEEWTVGDSPEITDGLPSWWIDPRTEH